MKFLSAIFVLAIGAIALTGCSGGESGPSDVKDIQAEMKTQTPADSKVLKPEEVGNDMMQMGGKKGGGG